jgi:hypothetical protein
MPPTILRALRHAKRIAGAAFAQYEGVALLVDNDRVVPKWTTVCAPDPDGSVAANRVRLALAVSSSVWVAQHLLRPWVRLLCGRHGRAQ